MREQPQGVADLVRDRKRCIVGIRLRARRPAVRDRWRISVVRSSDDLRHDSADFDSHPVNERPAGTADHATDAIVANLLHDEDDHRLADAEEAPDAALEQLVRLGLEPAPFQPRLIENQIALRTDAQRTLGRVADRFVIRRMDANLSATVERGFGLRHDRLQVLGERERGIASAQWNYVHAEMLRQPDADQAREPVDQADDVAEDRRDRTDHGPDERTDDRQLQHEIENRGDDVPRKGDHLAHDANDLRPDDDDDLDDEGYEGAQPGQRPWPLLTALLLFLDLLLDVLLDPLLDVATDFHGISISIPSQGSPEDVNVQARPGERHRRAPLQGCLAGGRRSTWMA